MGRSPLREKPPLCGAVGVGNNRPAAPRGYDEELKCRTPGSSTTATNDTPVDSSSQRVHISLRNRPDPTSV